MQTKQSTACSRACVDIPPATRVWLARPTSEDIMARFGRALVTGAVVLAAAGGVAFAAASIADDGGVIHGCYQKNKGSVRVVQSASECNLSEEPISWNR